MTIGPGVELPEDRMIEICRRYRVRELSLFGSAARGEMRPDSDVDLLVDFEPDARPSLFDVGGLIEDFSALLGRRVDIAVKPGLKPRVREEVLSEAQLLYAA